MILEDIFEDNLALIEDEAKLNNQINAIKRISKEAITWLQDGQIEAAISTYNRLIGHLHIEVRDYQGLNQFHLSPLAKRYVQTSYLLYENLPQGTTHREDLQNAYNNIIHELNKI